VAKPTLYTAQNIIHAALGLIPAVVLILSGHQNQGVAFAIGLLPSSLLGIAPTRKSRLIDGIIGCLFGAGVLEGSAALVLSAVPAPRLDHAGLAHDLGGRGARHVPAAARHQLAQRRGVGGRARCVPPHTRGRLRGQGHPGTETALGSTRDGTAGAGRRDERRGLSLASNGGRRSGPRASSWVAAGVVESRSAVTPPRVAQAWSYALGASGPGCRCSWSLPMSRSAWRSPHGEVSR
jgi:hypothetical protein